MRVLVTGGNGFVASHLVRRLRAGGDRVRCLVRRPGVPESLEGLDVEVATGDVTRPETLPAALDGADEVYHLAARLTSLTEREMLRTNLGGTRNLAEAALRAGVARFVHCSTLAVCGPSPDGRPLADDAPPRPVTWYGRSKALAERVVEEAGRRGLPYAILRPPVVYGPRDRGLLSIFRSVARGVAPLLGPQPKWYSWVHGADLAEALVSVGRHPAARGRSLFACHEEVATMEQFLDLVASAVGRRPLRLPVPDSLLRAVAGACDVVAQVTGSPGMLTRDKVHELTPRAWICSPAAAARATGWRAGVALASGVPETVRWYREHGWL